MAFKKGPPSGGNVVLNFRGDPESEFDAYAWGYHRAAKHLSDKLLTDRMYLDTDACPIIYMYRHAIELYLKHLILVGKKCLAMAGWAAPERAKDKITIHPISELFKRAEEILSTLRVWEPNETYAKETATIIEYVAQLDDNSYTFRYPTKKEGGSTVDPHYKLDVKDFSEKAEKICTQLEGCCMYLSTIEDDIAEQTFYYC